METTASFDADGDDEATNEPDSLDDGDSNVDSGDESTVDSDTDSTGSTDDSTEDDEDDSDIAAESTDRDDFGSIDDIDLCLTQTESTCGTLEEDDGQKLCAFNTQTNNCYAIMEQREGRFGRGNFDDGFIAAQTQHAQQATQLEAIIGIMGGVIAALVLVLICGGYYLYNKLQKVKIDKVLEMDELNENETENINIDDDGVELIDTR
jgi:uncharacterized membrane protein YciS (DUF1049 family)